MKTARVIFYVAAIVGVIYGLLFLTMPELQFELSQDPGVPANPGWVRWSGAFLIGIVRGSRQISPTDRDPSWWAWGLAMCW